MITSLDKGMVHEISEKVLETLKSLETEYGVKFNYKGGNFTPSSFIFRLEAALVNPSGEVEDREREDYKKYAESYGLKKEWLDTTFTSGGTTYTITGLATRRSKNPVMATSSRNGKTFIFPADMVVFYKKNP